MSRPHQAPMGTASCLLARIFCFVTSHLTPSFGRLRCAVREGTSAAVLCLASSCFLAAFCLLGLCVGLHGTWVPLCVLRLVGWNSSHGPRLEATSTGSCRGARRGPDAGGARKPARPKQPAHLIEIPVFVFYSSRRVSTKKQQPTPTTPIVSSAGPHILT